MLKTNEKNNYYTKYKPFSLRRRFTTLIFIPAVQACSGAPMSPITIAKLYEENDKKVQIISDRPWFKSFGNQFQKIVIVSINGVFFAVRSFGTLIGNKIELQKGRSVCCKL